VLGKVVVPGGRFRESILTQSLARLAALSPAFADLTPPRELVATNATWSYFYPEETESSAEAFPPSDWTQTDFDDSGWKRGPAPLGYGNGDEATVLSFGSKPSAKPITALFRHAFELESLPSPDIEALIYSMRRDDGVILYLNGSEVARDNLPEGDVTDKTTAITSIADTAEIDSIIGSIPASLLRGGSNIIAAEVHQANPGSSDMRFELQLATAWNRGAFLARIKEIHANPNDPLLEKDSPALRKLREILESGKINASYKLDAPPAFPQQVRSSIPGRELPGPLVKETIVRFRGNRPIEAAQILFLVDE
jgi:hypothetical protein